MTEQQQDVGFIEIFISNSSRLLQGKDNHFAKIIFTCHTGTQKPIPTVSAGIIHSFIHSFQLLLIFPFIQPCELSAVS